MLEMIRAPNVTLPHGSSVFGKYLTVSSAALLKRAGSTLLPENGFGKLTCPALLQLAEANDVKPPGSRCPVGTKAMLSEGSCRFLVPWYPAKKNSLFFLIGPPIVPPN